MDMPDMPGMGSSSSMMMDMPTSTATAAPAATSMTMGGMGGMGGMDMGNGGGHMCKISMLWNWNTVDACFLSTSWHIKSSGMFAGSCIGVILLAITLEGLRRSVKEYDRYLIRKNISGGLVAVTRAESPKIDPPTTAASAPVSSVTPSAACAASYRPKVWEQAIRALLHTAQFIVAYFLMLLAMYYNGYFIICIFIGAYIGSFVFQYEKLGGGQQTSAASEATVCCG
ncbi:Ctr copper transporter family-domain-containing protein [Annulohypoxylon maeteangense]|uniref:Ctr copper transporter family-domain-containing protein n=1 Tax=Annulohypoxylon maeteangense TaxID=1927788 RepID=UPI002007C2D1|nr:Ctr copper transporter family-domain-containing protein [Annulohypoxylon maeteangense]KAI0881581.1 Ctr copper transporter family-domain-containing protein [Annulohypoxylon maeteangense]